MNKAFKSKPSLLESAKFNKFISRLGLITRSFKQQTKILEKKTFESKLRILK